jgi:putative intracellular protease/amidase
MKRVIYMYVLNTMADWETGYLSQGLILQKMLPQSKFEFLTVSNSIDPIKTAGGITIIPDCSLKDIDEKEIAALILPGSDLWKDEENRPVLKLSARLLKKNVLISAICGATLALADEGLLDDHFHTSNSLYFLKGLSENYRGESYYRDEIAVKDGNLITASSAGGLLWARYILEYLDIFSEETVQAWYSYFSSGNPDSFEKLMNSLK